MNRRAFLASTVRRRWHRAAAQLPANKNVKWALSLGLWNHFKPVAVHRHSRRDARHRLHRHPPDRFPALPRRPTTSRRPRWRRRSPSATCTCARSPSAARRTIRRSTPKSSPTRARAMKFLQEIRGQRPGGRFRRRAAPGADIDARLRRHVRLLTTAWASWRAKWAFAPACTITWTKMVEKAAGDRSHHGHDRSQAVLVLARYRAPAPGRSQRGGDVQEIQTPPDLHGLQGRPLDHARSRLRRDNGKVHPKDSTEAKFFSSIYDLGDGEIDFPACHRILKAIAYKGWICVDLDTARKGPRASYERMRRVRCEEAEPIYT